MAFQIAVTRLHVQPSEFWAMRPRHFWALAETLGESDAKPSSRIPQSERAKIRDMLNGNDDGGWW